MMELRYKGQKIDVIEVFDDYVVVETLLGEILTLNLTDLDIDKFEEIVNNTEESNIVSLNYWRQSAWPKVKKEIKIDRYPQNKQNPSSQNKPKKILLVK